MDNLDIILKYYRNELNDEEKKKFLHRCKTDPIFAKEVKLFYVTSDKHLSTRGKELHEAHLRRKKKKRIILFFFISFIISIISFISYNSFIKKQPIGQLDIPNESIDVIIDTTNTNTPIEINNIPETKEDSQLIKKPKQPNIKKPKEPIPPQKDTSTTDLIFAKNLLPSNEFILDGSINIKVMGAGWKGKLQNKEYEDALKILNKDFIKDETLDEIEDIHLFHTALLELYVNKDYAQAEKLLKAVSENKDYIEQSKLHLFILLIQQEKIAEAKNYYLQHKATLDIYQKSNTYNMAGIVNQLFN